MQVAANLGGNMPNCRGTKKSSKRHFHHSYTKRSMRSINNAQY